MRGASSPSFRRRRAIDDSTPRSVDPDAVASRTANRRRRLITSPAFATKVAIRELCRRQQDDSARRRDEQALLQIEQPAVEADLRIALPVLRSEPSAAAASNQRADAGDQLAPVDRLHEAVVGTVVERIDPPVERVVGEQQDQRRLAASPQRSTDVGDRAIGDVRIDQQDVKGRRCEFGADLANAPRHADVDTEALQIVHERRPDARIREGEQCADRRGALRLDRHRRMATLHHASLLHRCDRTSGSAVASTHSTYGRERHPTR